jgi:hypothetical protein
LHDARKFWAAILIALTLIILILMVYAPKSQQVIVNVGSAPVVAANAPARVIPQHHVEDDVPAGTSSSSWNSGPAARRVPPWKMLPQPQAQAVAAGSVDLLATAAASGSGCQQTLRPRREHVRIPSLELALIQKELRVMVDVGSPSSGLSLFVATSPGVFVFSFGVETRMSHLLPKRPNWSINPPDPSVIGPGVDFLILQAWDAFMPVVRHTLDVGQPRYVIVIPLAPQCTDLRPLLKDSYRCTQINNKFVQCER